LPRRRVVVAKSGKASRVKRIVTQDGDLERAREGQAVTIVLDDEVEVSRGNMLVAPMRGRMSPTSSPPTSSGSANTP
jgi:bifunctional enzyme CysN/CysC